MIRAIHDVKGIDMGNSLVRYKAELDFDGRELSRSYLDKQDLSLLLEVQIYIFFNNVSIFLKYELYFTICTGRSCFTPGLHS